MNDQSENKTKSSSRLSGQRAYKLMHVLRRRINDVFNTAIQLHQTHEHIGDRIKNQLHDSPEFARLPNTCKEYLFGYLHAKHDNVWHLCIWMKSIDGKLLTTREVDELSRVEKSEGLDKDPEYKSPWHRVDSDLSCFVWKDEQGKPLPDKPFY